MANGHRYVIIVALLSLLSGVARAPVGAQEPTSRGIPVATPPQGTYYPAPTQAALGNSASGQATSPSTDRKESESLELRDIQQRLQRLEAQNAYLARQNEQLRNSLGLGPDGERLPPKSSSGDVTLASVVAPPADAAQAQAAEIAAGMEGLKSGMEKLGAGVEELGKHLTVTTADSDNGFKIALFGAMSGEMILADARPLIPSAVTMISPDFGRNTQIADISAKSSYLGAGLVGPCIGDLQAGGLFLSYFYSSTILDDAYCFFIARAYGELKNEDWRFSAGVDGDVINPLNPEMVDWNPGMGAGNIGFLRAQFRTEHYWRPSDESQVTVQFALSDPIPTNYENFSLQEGLTESNGWPNVEGRLALGFGSLIQRGGVSIRPTEFGVSGLVGQLRRTGDLTTPNSVADVWAVGTDARIAVTEKFGVKGEFYHGQTVGTYLGAIIQNFNANRHGIRSTGGWGELYYYWTPCLHSHFGYGIDQPLENDLTAGEPRRNQFCFGNILWDVTKSVDVGFEVSHWETAYMLPLKDNQAMVYDTRLRIKF
jgi:hypothetical protein